MTGKKYTTIRLEKKTIERIKKQWKHGNDTYDVVFNRVLDEVE